MWHRQQNDKDSYSPAEPGLKPGPAEPLPLGAPSETYRGFSRIGEGLGVQGEIQGGEDLRIDGAFEGSVRLADAAVAIGPQGRVRGDIKAREIVLEGRVRGNLRGDERVRIAAAGVLLGDAIAPRLAVEEGAVIRGRVEVTVPYETSAPGASAFAAHAGTTAAVVLETQGSSE